MSAGEQARLRGLYLDAVKRSLAGINCRSGSDLVPSGADALLVETPWEPPPARVRLVLAKEKRIDTDAKLTGDHLQVPADGQTMLGLRRLDQLQQCATTVIEEDVPGDFIEAGVWRGGAVILLRAVLEAYDDRTRRVWAADSFQGLPAPSLEEDAWSDLHRHEELAVSEDEVRVNFALYDLLDDQVRLVVGWFGQTLPRLQAERWSLVRLDGDLYESTWDGLEHLYPQLSPGGFLIVDDYGTYEACADAVHGYREDHGVTEPILEIDHTAVYWRKV